MTRTLRKAGPLDAEAAKESAKERLRKTIADADEQIEFFEACAAPYRTIRRECIQLLGGEAPESTSVLRRYAEKRDWLAGIKAYLMKTGRPVTEKELEEEMRGGGANIKPRSVGNFIAMWSKPEGKGRPGPPVLRQVGTKKTGKRVGLAEWSGKMWKE